jgi:hypothetical protein
MTSCLVEASVRAEDDHASRFLRLRHPSAHPANRVGHLDRSIHKRCESSRRNLHDTRFELRCKRLQQVYSHEDIPLVGQMEHAVVNGPAHLRRH